MEFYEEKIKEEDEYEKNKPAFFQKKKFAAEPESSDPYFDKQKAIKIEESKAWLNLQKQLEMDFDPETKSQDELAEFFKVGTEKNEVDHMNE